MLHNHIEVFKILMFNGPFLWTVVKCVGRVRVEFTRIPYTYWSMSFINPPELELTVESKLEGHSVPQLNRIIGIQVIIKCILEINRLSRIST